MRITLITGHAAESHRKTGFHFWADSLAKRGDDVVWITAGYSRLKRLKNPASMPEGPYNEAVPVKPHLRKYVWLPLTHAIDFKVDDFNEMTSPWWRWYFSKMKPSLKDAVARTDIFIVEGCLGLMLIPALAKLHSKAKFLYTVSDRLRTMNANRSVQDAERLALPHFTLIRVPSKAMLHDFPMYPVLYIPQGFDAAGFERAKVNPYTAKKNAVVAGDMLFDAGAIYTLAHAFPDWNFHLFGRNAHLPNSMSNVIEHGERPYDEVAAFIHYGDIALAPYRAAPDAAYIAQTSLKMIQYTQARLPIVAPLFAKGDRPHVLGYSPDDPGSIEAAFATAVGFDRTSIVPPDVLPWDAVLDDMLHSL